MCTIYFYICVLTHYIGLQKKLGFIGSYTIFSFTFFNIFRSNIFFNPYIYNQSNEIYVIL